MPTQTTNYDLEKPLVNDPVDEDLWGGYLNDNADRLDNLLLTGITIQVAASQTTGFTATASVSVKNLYPCDATAAAFAATLPVAATAGNGATVFFRKTDNSLNAVTVTANGAETINGSTTFALSTQYDFLGLVSDGVDKWHIITRTPQANAVTVIRQQEFSGNGTYTPHASMIYCDVKLVAGGGGGGGTGTGASGGGGGAGGYTQGIISKATIGASQAVTIGTGGAAGASGNTTSLGTLLSATGGAAGGAGTSSNGGGLGGYGGAGGSGSSAEVGIDGGDGGFGFSSSSANSNGGVGGASYFGGGGAGAQSSTSARDGRAYGSGGGGATLSGSAGAGRQGYMIITEYCTA